MNQKINCLVTGAAGFIGSHVADQLIENGFNVISLDDLSGGFTENINDRSTFVQGSVTDDVLIKNLFEKYRFEYVFHLAAYAAEGLSHFIRKFNYENNLVGSINLVNESIKHKVKCFVFTSSIAVYGKNQLPMTEELTPIPEDPYGISKYATELDLQCAHELFGLNHIIFRPHNVYGERQNIGDRYRNVIGIFMNKLLLGEDLIVFGDGNQTRAFSYISDVAPIIANSIRFPNAYNHVFNIGADKPYSVNELAEVVIKKMGINGKLIHEPARNEVVHAFSDHSKVRNFFNIKTDPETLESGIEKMAKWVNQYGARSTAKFKNIEIEENLPPSWK
jgi:UDP-glucose 4-epimerase